MFRPKAQNMHTDTTKYDSDSTSDDNDNELEQDVGKIRLPFIHSERFISCREGQKC
jgi:hypothetical protein